MTQLRNNYSLIKKKYEAISKGNVRLTQSDLVLFQPFNATSTHYRFPVLENEGTPANAEIRLNLNDEFVTNAAGVFLLKRLTFTGERDKTEVLSLQTYAPYELNNLALITLDKLYEGKMKIDVNNVNYVDRWHLHKHRVVQRTQYAHNNAASPLICPPTQSSIDQRQEGFFPTQPMVTFSGAKKNDVVIDLPEAIPFTAVTGQQYITDTVTVDVSFIGIAVIFRGLLAQNASKFQQ